MANIFTPSGNVVPAAGNINFNSNASSNAVRQVFGGATSNMQGLVGSNYNTSARPPPYTATLTVPTAVSGNLKLSFFAGKSIFLASPASLTITTPMNVAGNSLTTNVSGGGGTSFFVMVGTSNTGSTILSNVAAGAATVTIVSNTNYYISAYGSNAAGASSLLVSNATAFVSTVPPAPTSLSLAATTANVTPTFTASTGNVSTTYVAKIGIISGGTTLGNVVAVTSGSAYTTSVGSNNNVYISVAGSNSLGIGPYTSEIGPVVSSVPPSPTSLTLAATTANVTPTFTASTGNVSTTYRAKIGITSGGVTLGDGVVVTSGGAYTVAVGSNNNVYISVAGSNSLGLGPYTAVTGPTVSSLPPAPTSLSLAATTANVTPTFTASTGNVSTTYVAKIGITSGGTTLGNGVAVTSGSAYTVAVGSNNNVYISVAGVNSLGTGTYTAIVGPTVSSLPPPPTSLTLAATTANVTPTFTASTGNVSTTYVAKIGITSGGTTLGDGVVVTSGSAYTVAVGSNNNVYISVAGVNSLGTGTYSAITGPTVSSTGLATGLSLVITNLSSYVGNWTTPAGNAAFTGTWAITGTGVSLSGSTSTSPSTAQTTGTQTTALTPNATYTLTVTITNAKGAQAATTTAVAPLAAPTRLNFIDALPTTLDSTTTTTIRLSWTASAGVGVTYQVYVGGAASGAQVATTYKDFTIASGSWNGFIPCYVVPYVGASAGPASPTAYIAVYTTVGTVTPSMPGSFNSKWTVSLSGGRGGGGGGNGGYGTTIQTSTTAKYSTGMSLYIANSTRGTYGGTGPDTARDGGDLSKFAFGGVYAIAGGGGANGTGGGGGGGSSGGDGGQSDTGFTFDYSCCTAEYQQIGIGGGVSGGGGGAGGSGFYADAGGAYWNSQGGQDGFASSGNTGGNGRNFYGYGGGGGGGWVGGGGGGAGTGQAGTVGQRINCGSGGGAGSSGATAGFGAVSAYQGSTTASRYSGFAIIGSYDDGT